MSNVVDAHFIDKIEENKYPGPKCLWVFRVKNHDFTPKNHIFSNFRGATGCAPAPEISFI
jgi:hypothetical protein